MAQHTAGFGVGLRRLELEIRTVEFFRHRRGHGKAGRQPVGACRHGHAAFQELAAAPPRTDAIWAGHDISPLWLFSRLIQYLVGGGPDAPFCAISPNSSATCDSSRWTFASHQRRDRGWAAAVACSRNKV